LYTRPDNNTITKPEWHDDITSGGDASYVVAQATAAGAHVDAIPVFIDPDDITGEYIEQIFTSGSLT
jgi:hypothetical protein